MTFLETVAADLLTKTNGNPAKVTIVFPNKRASLFFSKALADQAGKPVWSPQYTTISELFDMHSDLQLGDRIKLVMELYKVYSDITKSGETIDQFYSWGELMLADFDDVDKHMADASKVFSLVSDMHALDSVDYLTAEQKKVLKQFFSNFTDQHNSDLKKNFLALWKNFHSIYTTYREHLEKQGIAYEGMLYRRVIEQKQLADADTTYAFVGFNLLNEVEKCLFSHFKSLGKAMFYWDYDAYYCKGQNGAEDTEASLNIQNEAGKYIVEHLQAFPNELKADNPVFHQFGKQTDVHFISAPTEDLQARYIEQWLTPERIAAGRKTAIVLADESLLETVLHCLPQTVSHVNVTTGFPLAQSPVASFIRLLMVLLARKSYTLHNVNAILRHPYARYISEQTAVLLDNLNEEKIYYPTLGDLALDDELKMLFTPLRDQNSYSELNERLAWAVTTVAKNIREESDDFANEALFRVYGILNRLKDILADDAMPELDSQLYSKLLAQIMQATTIPFHGEPIEGIQIMGVLETRNLDFDNLLLLSCNEGNLPAKVSDSSFIPHSIRKAYGLTTVENKVAIYSYYFHRMLQRTTSATVTYNNATTDGKTGEMSRFMLQLMAESPLCIENHTLVSGQQTTTSAPKDIAKTPDIVRKLAQPGSFSPSALGKYLRCPISFYYCYVEGIYDNDESDVDEIDNRIFGNIFHRSAELLYKQYTGKTVSKQTMDYMKSAAFTPTLEGIVDQAFREELFNIQQGSTRSMPTLGGLQVVNREMILHFMRQLIRYDAANAPFSVIGLETKQYTQIEANTIDGLKKFRVGGIIDRLDSVCDATGKSCIRVIDYKTGKYKQEISLPDVDAIFDNDNIEKHSDYFLQAMLYSGIVSEQYNAPVSPELLFVQKIGSEKYSPKIKLEKDYVTDVRTYSIDFILGLKKLIEEILDVQKPFGLPSKESRCENCAYCRLCYS